MKQQAKEYKLQWMSLYEAKLNHTETVTTNNPKMALFNFACKMLITAVTIFGNLPCERIMDNIKTGKTSDEHYWIEYPNGEILSILETIKR